MLASAFLESSLQLISLQTQPQPYPMALGTSAGTFQAKQLTRQGYSPTQEQTVCLKTPKFTPFPGHDCPPRGQGPGPTHPCAGTRPGTPRTLNTHRLWDQLLPPAAGTRPRTSCLSHQQACCSCRPSLTHQHTSTSAGERQSCSLWT